MKKTYKIITFGCQMNERDSESIAGILSEMGYERSEDRETASVVVINTCSIRENADKRFFGVLGQLKNPKLQNPDKIVAVCGCMMQIESSVEIIKKKYPWVDIIFGTHNIHKLKELMARKAEMREMLVDIWKEGGPIPEGCPAERTHNFKAYVNIMYGCNNFCSYCIVPYTRGRERSRSPESILSEVRSLAASGAKEITLLGQNVNSYGRAASIEGSYTTPASGGVDFAGLINIIAGVDGIERIRFMTSHPKDISPSLIESFRDCDKLCKHIHLPLQSGSDRILAAMNRKYDRKRYISVVEGLRDACPHIAITTDIIVGFPGETGEDFEDTLDMVRRVEYDGAFTFLYSPRPGTPANFTPDEASVEEKRDRFNRLTEVLHDIQAKKNALYAGRVVDVLVEGESRTDSDSLTGRTDSFKVVDFPRGAYKPAGLEGKILPVEIIKAGTFSLYGKLRI